MDTRLGIGRNKVVKWNKGSSVADFCCGKGIESDPGGHVTILKNNCMGLTFRCSGCGAVLHSFIELKSMFMSGGVYVGQVTS